MPNPKILLVILIVIGGLAFLVVSALGGNTQQYVTVTELTHSASASPDTAYKLKAKIVDGTVDYDPQVPRLCFDLSEGPGSPAIHVQSSETKPDNFKPGNECIVEGTYDRARGQFVASKVMTKCPSKYEGQQESKTTKQ